MHVGGIWGAETRQSLGGVGGWGGGVGRWGRRSRWGGGAGGYWRRRGCLASPARGDPRRHRGDGQGRLGERGIAGDSLVKSERRHPLPPDRSSISPQHPAELVLAAPELMNMPGVI